MVGPGPLQRISNIGEYRESDPYGPLRRLPPSLKLQPLTPQIYACIDFFHSSDFFDKKEVTVLPTGKASWMTGSKADHGHFVASLAVGEHYGLAPDAQLTIAPVDEKYFHRHIADHLKEIQQQKERGSPISVVGISLVSYTSSSGVGVRKEPFYQELAMTSERLHELGVAVVVAVGNNEKEGQYNALARLPHVIRVGAVDSRGTARLDDDRPASYSSGGCLKQVDLCAHADPALFLFPNGHAVVVPEGGTSAAQPQAAGALLLLGQVNALLGLEEKLSILIETQYVLGEAQLEKEIREGTRGEGELHLGFAMNPMKAFLMAAMLPGSAYAPEKLPELAHHLQVDPEEVRSLPLFQELQKRLLPQRTPNMFPLTHLFSHIGMVDDDSSPWGRNGIYP